MEPLKNVLGRKMLVLEGAMGTMLQQAGLMGDGAPEVLNLIEPESISRIHSFYRLAGADCAITNTFGANRAKLAHYGVADMVEPVNRKAVGIARKGAAPYVLGDMGPSGLAGASFDELYGIFHEQACALASGKPDGFLLETFTDIAEIRAAIIACRDAAADLPIIALVSFGEAGRMELSGTDPQAAAVILEGLGVDALGMNCGLGPAQMEPLAAAMRAASRLPMVVQPNAGMPTLASDGSTVFPGKPEEFSAFAAAMRDLGVAAVGSCCGSDPEFTACISEVLADAECVQSSHYDNFGLRIASQQTALSIGKCVAGFRPLRSIGERINPTGKPALKQQLTGGSMTLVRSYAAEQIEAGADILDINVGVAGIDEPAVLSAAVSAVGSSFPVPVAIDTTNPEALEAALKAYPGKALVNSVTGEARSLAAVLPLVARYGAAVVVLALDDDGIPATAQDRLACVKKIRDYARAAGVRDEDLLVDSLVMAAAADKDAPRVTLETMRLVREELGLATVLGVSNVSHGLPNRALLNAAFLTAAASYGLDAAIVNPNDTVMSEAIKLANTTAVCETMSSDAFHTTPSAHNTHYGRGDHSKPGIEDAAALALATFEELLTEALKPQHIPAAAATTAADGDLPPLSARDQLAHAIVLGDSDGAPACVDVLIREGVTPTEIIEDILTPAIQGLGEGFAEGTVFLPQLMVAADAMKAAVDQAKSYLPERTADGAESDTGQGGTAQACVVFATVKGDIHSIGKDICCSLLESQDVRVVNLGVDVPAQVVVDAVREHAAGAVCLSALMTTTLPAMTETTRALQAAYPDLPVLLGGAVVTEDWAAAQGALFEPDAPALAARIVKLLKD